MMNETDIPKKTKSMLRHSFVRGLSSISEKSESTDINDKEKVQWINRHNSGIHMPSHRGEGVPESRESSQKTTINPMNEFPPFYEGQRPRYRLIHINWEWTSKFKSSGHDDKGKKRFRNDMQGIFKRVPKSKDTQNSVTPHSSRKTRNRVDLNIKEEKKSNRPPKHRSIHTNNENIPRSDDVTDNEIHSNKKVSKVLAKITAIKKKMQFKATVIEKITKDQSNHLSFRVGRKPFPSNSDSKGSPSVGTLSPTSSHDSEMEDTDSM